MIPSQAAKPSARDFDYQAAFDRNLGWLTSAEQEILRRSCVAIAGLGGAGGFQIQALARLGIGKFKIADPDIFELSNVNRQVGATQETLGHSKTEVLREMILSINPAAEIETFTEAIHERNIDKFLDSVNLVIDGIDFFEQDAKWLLFRKSYARKIPALTCCPLGFGASLIIFSPDGMRYEDYFDLRKNMNEKEKRIALSFGLSPSPLCLPYMNAKAISHETKRAASVSPGLMLVGAITGTEAVKILTEKSGVRYCPNVYQIDLMTQQVRRKFYRWGMKSPWMRVKRWLATQWMNAQIHKAANKPSGKP